MLQRPAQGSGRRYYDRRGTEQVLRGRGGMLTLVAEWARIALANQRS
jgi:hypothetical protein